jgi:uncharacterized protein YciI
MLFDEFVVVRLLATPEAPELDPDEEARVQDAHLAYLHRLWSAGELLAAGPARGGDVMVQGLSIMACSLDEARRLLADDPGVLAGRFTPECVPWLVPRGMIIAGPGEPPASIADVLG